MRFFYKGKDGGPESPVEGYWLFEIKWLFSIVILKFNKGCRSSYHTHAFNALTWFLKGDMVEESIDEKGNHIEKKYTTSLIPKVTHRTKLHRVKANETSWALSIRGRWDSTWFEYEPTNKKYIRLSKGRVKC